MHVISSRAPVRTALILGVMVVPAPLAVDMFLPALPQITVRMDASVPATQATLTAYFLAFGLAHLIYGPWSDARGRLPVLRVGVLIFLLGTVACTLAQTIESLILGRVMQAIGAAAFTVIPRAMIRDMLTGSAATRLTAQLMLVLSVAPLVAPLAGSGMLAFSDWRGIFAVLAILAFGSYCISRFVLTETLPHIERYPITRRALMRGVGRLAADRTFLGLTALASFGLANFFVFVCMAPYLYKWHFGLGHLGVSLALAINGLGFFATAQLAAPLADRMGAQRTMLWGAASFGAVICATTLLADKFDLPLAVFVGLLALANAGLGLTIPTALSRALEPHGPITGLAASVSGAIQMAVTGILILVATTFLSPTKAGVLSALTICATLTLAAALWALRPRLRTVRWVRRPEI